MNRNEIVCAGWIVNEERCILIAAPIAEEAERDQSSLTSSSGASTYGSKS